SIQTERGSAKQRPGRVLADEIILCAVTQLDSAVLHGVEHLQPRYDLAGGEDLDLEFAVGCLRNIFRKAQTGAKQRVERLRPARSQTPPQLRRGLRDSGCGDCGACNPDTGGLQELTTFHKRKSSLSAEPERRRFAWLQAPTHFKGLRRL